MPTLDISFRPATPRDRDVILHHRRSMFRDMGEGTDAELDHMAEATSPWLEQALSDGSYRAWLAHTAEGKVVAGGGILVSHWPARPGDLNIQRALILNVYTEPEFRHRGLARQLMLLMIHWLKEEGFHSVALHASTEGRHLYETLGFIPTNEMRLQFGKDA